jgi:hypothetical protein
MKRRVLFSGFGAICCIFTEGNAISSRNYGDDDNGSILLSPVEIRVKINSLSSIACRVRPQKLRSHVKAVAVRKKIPHCSNVRGLNFAVLTCNNNILI